MAGDIDVKTKEKPNTSTTINDVKGILVFYKIHIIDRSAGIWFFFSFNIDITSHYL